MKSDPVVVMHQVLANVSLSLVAAHVARGWYRLCFQAAKTPLHRRTIPAVSSAAHSLTHAVTPQPLAKVALPYWANLSLSEIAGLAACHAARKPRPAP